MEERHRQDNKANSVIIFIGLHQHHLPYMQCLSSCMHYPSSTLLQQRQRQKEPVGHQLAHIDITVAHSACQHLAVCDCVEG